MPRPQPRLVLEIDIVGIEIFAKGAGDVPVSSVIVQLSREPRCFGDRPRPLRHHVATADGDVPGSDLTDAPTVEIALQRDVADRRRVPIRAKTALAQVPVIRGVLAAGQRGWITVKARAVDPVAR